MTVKQFLNLEWKQIFRSSHWQKSIALNILLIFFAIYFMVVFLIMGIAIVPILKDTMPGEDVFKVINNYIFYWVLADLFFRFFFQKLPVMSVKPLLTLNVKRSKVVHYVLGKSATSFFNILPLFATIPCGVMLIRDGYSTSMVLTWIVVLVLISIIINFLNFIIRHKKEYVTSEFLLFIENVMHIPDLNIEYMLPHCLIKLNIFFTQK